MTDILERLRLMHYRFAAESENDAANRRVQTAKDAAEEIKKLREAIEMAIDCIQDKDVIGARQTLTIALGETQ